MSLQSSRIKAQIIKPARIKFLQWVFLLSSIFMTIPFISSVNSLPSLFFVFYGEFYKFWFLLGIVSPSLFFWIIFRGLVLYPKGKLITILSSVISATWYFVLTLISLYLRFTIYGKCGFEGFISSSNNAVSASQCSEVVVTLGELTGYIFIYTTLFALLWYTTLAIIKSE